MNPKKFLALLLLFASIVTSVFAITYSYVPETNLIWRNAKAKGGWYDPETDSVTVVSHAKMLKLGVLKITGLPTNQDSGSSFMMVGLPPSPVQVNGPFRFHDGSVTDRIYNGMYVSGVVNAVIKIVAQYMPRNGVPTMINLTDGGTFTIDLFPEYHKTSLDMDIFLIIGESLAMNTGTTYYIDNISNYLFTLKDEQGNLIEGEGINVVNNPFTEGSSQSTWSGTEGAVKPVHLNADLTLLDYPNKTPLGIGATIELPTSIQLLTSGVNLAYIRTDFSVDNQDAGMTKSVLIKITHDELKNRSVDASYEYALALSHAEKDGTVGTVEMTQGYSLGDLSYKLVNSSAGDYDIKLLTFKFLTNDFENAPKGSYCSTVRFELSVLD